MTAVELKTNFHSLIDDIENIGLLDKFYHILTTAKTLPDGSLWSSLSRNEQNELVQIEIDSHNIQNLLPHSKIKQKYSQWL